MRIAVYETGADPRPILRIVSCPASAVEMQAGEGEAVVEIGPDVSDATHHIVDGVAAPIAP